MRAAVILLGIGLTAYSGARIMMETWFQADPRVLLASSRLLIPADPQLADFVRDEKAREDAEGLKAALELSQEALSRNPASPFRWCDLGFALLDSGRKEEARRCFERAVKLGPNMVPNLALAAQFYDSIAEPRQALGLNARILELASSEQENIFGSYTSSQYDPADVLKYGLPQNPTMARAYFRVMLRNDERDPVHQAWTWLAARSIPDGRLTNEYVDFLVKGREYDEAVATWLSYLGENRGNYLKSDFLYNGGFETEPSGSIFDWRIGRAPGVEVTRDTGVVHSGGRSLQVAFGGETNVSFRGVSQEVILSPGNYRFQAHVRTEGITTDKGIAFRIYDADNPARLDVRTPQLTGTHDWTELKADVRVPEPTRRIRVELIRDPSEKFDNKIKGTVWIDDVRFQRPEVRGQKSEVRGQKSEVNV